MGAIAILVPSFKRLKVWAYAGLFFDLAGATYSVIAKYGVDPAQSFMTDLISNQFKLSKRGRVNLGISKKISAAATFRATVNDIFYTPINNGIINNLVNTEAKWRNANDTRTITLLLNFRFGKAISDLRRHNAIGAQREQNRVKD